MSPILMLPVLMLLMLRNDIFPMLLRRLAVDKRRSLAFGTLRKGKTTACAFPGERGEWGSCREGLKDCGEELDFWRLSGDLVGDCGGGCWYMRLTNSGTTGAWTAARGAGDSAEERESLKT
jgi:hypothetical protein